MKQMKSKMLRHKNTEVLFLSMGLASAGSLTDCSFIPGPLQHHLVNPADNSGCLCRAACAAWAELRGLCCVFPCRGGLSCMGCAAWATLRASVQGSCCAMPCCVVL